MSRQASKRGRKQGDKRAADGAQPTIVPPPPPTPRGAGARPDADSASFESLPPELLVEEHAPLASSIEELRTRPNGPPPARPNEPAAPPVPVAPVEDAALVDALVEMRPFYREREQKSERAPSFDFADLSLLPGNPYQGSSLRPPPSLPSSEPRRWPARVALGAAFVGIAVLAFFAGQRSERPASREAARAEVHEAAQPPAPVVEPATPAAAPRAEQPAPAEPVREAESSAATEPEAESAPSAVMQAQADTEASAVPVLARGWHASEPAVADGVAAPPAPSDAAPTAPAPATAPAAPAAPRASAAFLATPSVAPSASAPVAPPVTRAVAPAQPLRPARGSATSSASVETSFAANPYSATPPASPAPATAPSAPASARAAAFFAAASSAEAEARAAAEAAAAKPAAPLPKLPAPRAVRAAFERIHAQLAACAEGKHGLVTIRATITGDGHVTSASASGVVTGAEEHACLARALQAAQFPPFTQSTFSVSYALAL